jgi:hypothetical protein
VTSKQQQRVPAGHREQQHRDLEDEAREIQRADDEAGQRSDRHDVEQRAPGLLDAGDHAGERRAVLALQQPDAEGRRYRGHAGRARFPVRDHQRVDEDAQRHQEHPAMAHDVAEPRNALTW